LTHSARLSYVRGVLRENCIWASFHPANSSHVGSSGRLRRHALPLTKRANFFHVFSIHPNFRA
jgi:hypothetical protein